MLAGLDRLRNALRLELENISPAETASIQVSLREGLGR
jgi:hypothetical protein